MDGRILAFCMVPERMASCGIHQCTTVPLYPWVPYIRVKSGMIEGVCSVDTPTPLTVLYVLFSVELHGGTGFCDMSVEPCQTCYLHLYIDKKPMIEPIFRFLARWSRCKIVRSIAWWSRILCSSGPFYAKWRIGVPFLYHGDGRVIPDCKSRADFIPEVRVSVSILDAKLLRYM